jgi:hypothetical protein
LSVEVLKAIMGVVLQWEEWIKKRAYRGFGTAGWWLLPGLLYKQSQKNKKGSSKDQAAQASQAANVRVAEASSSGKMMKKGGKVSSSRKCSHNRLY